MNERLLQFIWQFQYFNRVGFQTTSNEEVTIIYPGKPNYHQGPDFLEAKIKIDDKIWVGSVELHTFSSDWIKHKHSGDNNFSNVILHVVWRNDLVVSMPDGPQLPTVELHNRVSKLQLERYEYLMQKELFIPCTPYLPALDELKWIKWKERLIVERLQRKSGEVLAMFNQANRHWEELFWWKLAANFGTKVNSDIFMSIAQSISINTLAKHKNQLHQLEALLLGQANLLNGNFRDDYPQMLQKEYGFLQRKLQLKKLTLQPYFLRMRPANFPTIRLSQLSMLVHQSNHLFSKVKEVTTISELMDLLSVSANDYWLYHYQLDEPSEYRPKPLGKQMVENIIINTIIPISFAYGEYVKDEKIKNKAMSWLSELQPEKNSITNKWTFFGVSNENALESQALIELKNNYCNERRCLDCAVGNEILKNKAE